MAYSELIKNFEKIRSYMREFYVYGFKSREGYDAASARSYDNERRRIESWLGEYMGFRRDSRGKTVFLTVDNRSVPHNPLYRAFKARSFTDNDVVLHFAILDLLREGKPMTVRETADRLAAEYMAEDRVPDESTVRKKLKEYERLGLLTASKVGRELAFRLAPSEVDLASWEDAVSFFSEADPLGVVGSYLLDKGGRHPDLFSYKHHYLLHALDSQVLYDILLAMREKRRVELTSFAARKKELRTHTVLPVKIYISTQTGREYLLAYHFRFRRPMFFRIDNIRKISPGDMETQMDRYAGFYGRFRENLWGVSTGAGHSLDHLEMTVQILPGEEYILRRLEREKRCGRVEAVDGQTYKFTADVYDALEMLPWLRTFIGRIIKLECSSEPVTRRFYGDLEAMRRQYGGDGHDLQ